ncbi:MAG: lipoyl synthase [Thermodesulfobacteriota bacterium]|nr:lipoyl synthase [Thermodesulfobacteriota bacterium]
MSISPHHSIDTKPGTCLAVELSVTDYDDIHRLQLDMVAARYAGVLDRDVVFILEHNPVFTIGRHGNLEHLIVDRSTQEQKRIPVIRIERGGEITYHGPGQVVGYPIIDLKAARISVKAHMNALEEIMTRTAADFGVEAARNPINPGIWVDGRKLGSIGVAVRHGITFHGFALNVNLSLEPFSWINPCGLEGVRMTSLEKEKNAAVTVTAVRNRIWHHLAEVADLQIDFVALSSLPVSRSTRKTDDTLANDETGKPTPQKMAEHIRQPANRPAGKPKWLRRRLPSGPAHEKVRNLIRTHGLHTVCEQAKCPNQFECFSQQTATFLILGDRCTRDCRFCNVPPGPDQPPDPDEPRRVAETARKMGLKYVVITSVTRDDLPDGGAALFAETIRRVHRAIDDVRVEVLIPDFQGKADALKTVLAARPDVLNHNIETVVRLYPIARPQAEYGRSLELLNRVSTHNPPIPSKSGLMLGLGESEAEIKECLRDIFDTGCHMLTLGQYLQPSLGHLPVARFVPPEEFDAWRNTALKMGFKHVASGPFVRSSYHAKDLYRESRKT